MNSEITCLLTIHGIGFEQPPQDGVDNSGYADPLHQHLKTILGNSLSDDPKRKRNQPGENGVIYVQSRWPNAQGIASREEGLKRLGSWANGRVDETQATLVENDEPISHVALVYSNLEATGIQGSAALQTAAMALSGVSHYATISGLFHLALADTLAVLNPSTGESNSTYPRTDLRLRSLKPFGHAGAAAPPPSPGLLSIIRNLEDDVACYVCFNEERERVRSFVYEALLRLAARSDVANLVINAHSNGSVIAFDVLRYLPQEVTRKIKAFVTSGSPLRKYVDLFHWGNQIQCRYPVTPWYNFWDPCDPVADPLNLPISWHIGQQIVSSSETLFSRIDLQNEIPSRVCIEDRQVNNVENSRGGGLQAHNYWDNEKQFVAQLADLLRSMADEHPLANAA